MDWSTYLWGWTIFLWVLILARSMLKYLDGGRTFQDIDKEHRELRWRHGDTCYRYEERSDR